MGRFYQTSSPEFTDFVYKPPYELAQKVLATKQMGYDNAMQQTGILNGLLEVNHRNTDEENKNVNNIKNYYEQRIDDISSKLQQSPGDYNKYLPEITKLQREISKDRQEGDLSKIEGTYNNYLKYQKDMEKLRTSDPERYNAAIRNADTQWGGNSLKSGIWNQEDIIANPDFNKLWKEQYEVMKADSVKNGYQNVDGRWIKETNGKVEELNEDKLKQAAFSKIMQQPEMGSYMQQSQKWGLGNYYKNFGQEDQQFINPFTLKYNGQQITSEEFDKLSDDEQRKVELTENMESSLAPMIRTAGFSSYKQTENETKLKENPVASQEDKQAHDKEMAALKHANDLERDNNNWSYKLKKDLQDKAKKGDEGAKTELEEHLAKETFGIITDKSTGYYNNINKFLAGDKIALQNEQNARANARNKMNFKAGTPEHNFMMFYDQQVASGNLNREKIAEQWVDQNYEYKPLMFKGKEMLPEPISEAERNPEFRRMKVKARQRTDMFDKMLGVADKYIENKSEFLSQSVSESVDFHPVTNQASDALAKTINMNSTSYYMTDAKGNKISGDELPKISKVTDVTGVNPKENIGMTAILEDGTQAYIFPSSSEQGRVNTRIVKNLILDKGLANSDSTLYKELENEQLQEVDNLFQNTIPSADGIKRVRYTVPGSGETLPIHQVGTNYYLVDPTNPKNKVKFDKLSNLLEAIK